MVLQQEPERKLLSDDAVPFAPVAPAAGRRPVVPADRLLGWTHRWRFPLALIFGALIGVAAFSAYESKQPVDPVSTTPGTGRTQPDPDEQAGALSVAVGDMASGENGADDSDVSTTTDPRRTATTAFDAALVAPSSDTTRRPITSRPTATSSAATSTVLSTTAPTSTTIRPTTTLPPTTADTAPPIPATIGDRITFETSGGRGVNGIPLVLLNDTDGNGVGESVRLTDNTNTAGRYSWSVDPGCYVVVFSIPAGQTILQGSDRQALCVTSGQTKLDVDLVITLPFVEQPSSCQVQIGTNSLAGVEIHHPQSAWAPSYIFYDSSGNFIISTNSLGPPDDLEPDEPSIEWTSSGNGFEESDVYSVAAEHEQGVPSSPVTCSRINV